MMRNRFVFIGRMAGVLMLVAGCGGEIGPASTGPPPALIAPTSVLLRTPKSTDYNSFEVTVAFSPDGSTVAAGRMEFSRSGGDEDTGGTVISLCDVASGRERATINEPFGEGSGSVAFSPDGRALAVGLRDSIKLYDPETGRERAELATENSYGPSCLSFSPDGLRLAATTMLGDLVVWDLGSRRQSAKMDLHTRSAEGVAVSPDGKLVATAAQGGVVCRSFFGLSGWGVGCGPGPGVVRVFDLASGVERARHEHGYQARSVSFSPDGKTLASGGGVAKLWDLATGEGRTIIDASDDLAVYCVAFSPDGGTLAIGLGSPDFSGSAGEVRLWDVAGGRVRAWLRGEAGKIRALAFGPDGKTLVTGSSTAIVLWRDARDASATKGRPEGER